MAIWVAKQTGSSTTTSVPVDPKTSHPLDPLSVDEINEVVSVVKGKGGLDEGLLFETIVLREPPKNAVLDFGPGKTIPREASVVALDCKKEEVYELDVSLKTGKIRGVSIFQECSQPFF